MGHTYHKGELKIQEKFGEQKIADRAGRMINNAIIPGASAFIENQNSCIISSMDINNNVWISLLVGEIGFVEVPDLTNLFFRSKKITSSDTDIFYDNIKENPNVGSLFIEFSSRRRYRINGKVITNAIGIGLNIEEAYPNCPKYIQRRLSAVSKILEANAPSIKSGESLSQLHIDWITKSDTLFVGTVDSTNSLDASHRGGKEGFVEVLDDNTLKIPDYKGNKMYNTLGNILENKNAGLLFIDFEKKRTLQLTGKAELLFDQTTEADHLKTTGTGRYWLFKTKAWIQTDNHHQMEWEFLDASPLNP
ncbi:hypothetical protein A8C32_18430 [Flavivirga aquatica]|uniref:Pyridoxamine 5'-phosphate oxidase N-terminal domain-containing protein n=1 Tax=Flavivirga aquatica TaxID=1849968 RepID=A0A1E5T7S7_9FLAO|nr:pyridoxamine 5'-phosphate oxidase family protein [Flavivirga aquatica]OEK07410.1 hypothetical protein A8C32_18430 [Flavivirga aquatica]